MLQRKSIIHRDLHGGNIILTKEGIKIIDFGKAVKDNTYRLKFMKWLFKKSVIRVLFTHNIPPKAQNRHFNLLYNWTKEQDLTDLIEALKNMGLLSCLSQGNSEQQELSRILMQQKIKKRHNPYASVNHLIEKIEKNPQLKKRYSNFIKNTYQTTLIKKRYSNFIKNTYQTTLSKKIKNTIYYYIAQLISTLPFFMIYFTFAPNFHLTVSSAMYCILADMIIIAFLDICFKLLTTYLCKNHPNQSLPEPEIIFDTNNYQKTPRQDLMPPNNVTSDHTLTEKDKNEKIGPSI